MTVRRLALWLCVATLLAGCRTEEAPERYAARVGDMYLTQSELDASLRDLAGLDTIEARRQIIEQWVTRTLLLQEALALNLENMPEVQKRLQEQERAVLVTALTNRIYDEAEVEPTPSEVRDYFERHRDQLRLREPYVRIRHLATQRREAAERLRRQLQALPTDSLWARAAPPLALNPSRALGLAQQYVPEARLFSRMPTVRNALAQLRDGGIAPVIRTDSVYHVLQLVERVSEGSPPELAWVEPEIRRRLVVRARKQMYAREVQRLRNEAKARNALEVR
jgi:hypothetical protein